MVWALWAVNQKPLDPLAKHGIHWIHWIHRCSSPSAPASQSCLGVAAGRLPNNRRSELTSSSCKSWHVLAIFRKMNWMKTEWTRVVYSIHTFWAFSLQSSDEALVSKRFWLVENPRFPKQTFYEDIQTFSFLGTSATASDLSIITQEISGAIRATRWTSLNKSQHSWQRQFLRSRQRKRSLTKLQSLANEHIWLPGGRL